MTLDKETTWLQRPRFQGPLSGSLTFFVHRLHCLTRSPPTCQRQLPLICRHLTLWTPLCIDVEESSTLHCLERVQQSIFLMFSAKRKKVTTSSWHPSAMRMTLLCSYPLLIWRRHGTVNPGSWTEHSKSPLLYTKLTTIHIMASSGKCPCQWFTLGCREKHARQTYVDLRVFRALKDQAAARALNRAWPSDHYHRL